MGFNRRKMEDERRRAAEKESANRRASEAQVLEDVERLIAAWNERAKPSECQCCSRQPSVPRSPPDVGPGLAPEAGKFHRVPEPTALSSTRCF